MQQFITDSKNTTKASLLGQALLYCRQGFSVIPVHSVRSGKCTCGKDDCQKPGKHPRIEWGGFQRRRAKEAEIIQWWKRWPCANIGIVTGSISRVVVLDIDGETGVESVRGKALPNTVVAESGGGGWHYFFKYPEGQSVGSTTGLLPRVDIRADRGFVVVAPSNHISGEKYSWVNEPGNTKLADVPEWLVELLGMQKNITPAEAVSDVITEGARNNVLASLAGTMRRRGMSQEAIGAALEAENQVKCKPPLDQAEVVDIVTSICRYAPAEVPKKTGGRKVMDLSQVLVKPDIHNKVEINWIIPNLIPAGYVSLFVGDPKSGKTWLALRLATDLSKGGSILDGLFQAEPVKVLYVMGDTGSQLVNYRLQKTGWEYNEDNIRFAYAEDIRSAGGDLNLSFPEGSKLLGELAMAWGARLIIVDTLTSLHGSDENNNKEMSVIISRLRDLAIATNAGLVVLHHSRKKKRNEMNLEMTQHDSVGAGVLSRLVGNIVGIERKVSETGEANFLVRSLASWFREFKPFSFTLKDEFQGGRDLVKMTLDTPEIDKNSKDIVIRAIKASYWDGEQFTRADVIKRTRLSEKTVSTILNELVNEGVVKARGSTKNKIFYIPQ